MKPITCSGAGKHPKGPDPTNFRRVICPDCGKRVVQTPSGHVRRHLALRS